MGYSNKDGRVFNLLRDDLGHVSDPLGINYENAFSRGAPAGEYTVNVHLYGNRAGVYPVPVTIAVSVRGADGGATRAIATREVRLLSWARRSRCFASRSMRTAFSCPAAYVARLIRARLAGRRFDEPFRYRHFGDLATIGRSSISASCASAATRRGCCGASPTSSS